MVDIKCTVLPKPHPSSAVLDSRATIVPYFNGTGPDSYFCGNCNFLVAKNITKGQIQNLVVTCPQCKSFNELN